MQVPRHTRRQQRHAQQVGIDADQRFAAENAYQDEETQEHHADRHQHGRHILRRLAGSSRAALACHHRDGGRAAVQPADDARHQDARLMEHIATQQVGQVRNARYHHRGQPDAVGRQVDARNKVLVGQHGQNDAADGQELGQRGHLVVLHALRQLGEGMLQLGKKQHRDHQHDGKPRRLRHDHRRQAIGDKGNDNGGDAKDMILRLLDIIVQSQQQSQHRAAAHEQAVVCRVKNIEQVTQYAYESKRTVRTEQSRLTLALQADFALRQPDEQGKHGHQQEGDQLARQVLVDSFHNSMLCGTSRLNAPPDTSYPAA